MFHFTYHGAIVHGKTRTLHITANVQLTALFVAYIVVVFVLIRFVVYIHTKYTDV